MFWSSVVGFVMVCLTEVAFLEGIGVFLWLYRTLHCFIEAFHFRIESCIGIKIWHSCNLTWKLSLFRGWADLKNKVQRNGGACWSLSWKFFNVGYLTLLLTRSLLTCCLWTSAKVARFCTKGFHHVVKPWRMTSILTPPTYSYPVFAVCKALRAFYSYRIPV